MELTRGKVQKAQKAIVYGPEGIGKSTFASKFPDPVFCDTEGSTYQLDVARTPAPSSWTMLLETVRYFIANPTLCKTFVLDTADWAERMCVKHVCDQHEQKSVEGFGYGKGYVYVYEEFGKLLNLLSEVINKGVNVVITAHAQLRKVDQPDEMGSYDRYELKLTKRTGAEISAMLKEWADLVLFANYKTLVVNVDGQGATKGKNKAQGGKRVMYASHNPSWDAKNRHGLPDELPFDYTAIAHLFAADHRSSMPPPLPASVQRIKDNLEKDVQSGVLHPSDAETVVEMAKKHYDDSTQTLAQPPEPSDGIPQALRDLMEKDKVSEQEIMFAVSAKGYYPSGTPIAKYDPAYINGVLIAAWPQVRSMVETNRQTTPF